MAIAVSNEIFDQCVNDALDTIPDALLALIENCVILVEEFPPPGQHLFGVYEGIPLTERGANYAGVLPDRILIFREPHKRTCHSIEELVEEIHVTVVHEIAHHFGIDDDALAVLGYQ